MTDLQTYNLYMKLANNLRKIRALPNSDKAFADYYINLYMAEVERILAKYRA